MTPIAHGKFAGRRLIVFGCGYVGSAVAEVAVREGMSVTGLTRNRDTAAALRDMGVNVVCANLTGADWQNHLEPASDYVLNCVSSGGGDLASYRQSYVGGMESILGWARAHGRMGTFVYTSSTSVYPQDGGVVVDETADSGIGTERAQLLGEAERLLTKSAGVCDRWFVLRLAGIYGPARHGLLDQVREGVMSGNASAHINLIHLDDIVSAVFACFSAPTQVRDEIFNVADDGAASRRDVAHWLATRIGAPHPVFSGAPAGARRAMTPDRVIANDKLKTKLGWNPRFADFRRGYEQILSHKEG